MSAKAILVVDDDPNAVDIVRTYLESEGYLVETASDGRQALSKIEEIHPDLILLDVMMPGMDGLEVSRVIKNHPALGGTRVVLLTAKGDFSDKQKGLHAGADDYLVKPITLEALSETVDRNLKARNESS